MSKILLALVLILSTVSLITASEGAGSIEGRVIEQSTKQPLAGANVFVLNTNYGAATDENGKYRIQNIPAGYYQIRVSTIGYETVIKSDINISVNRVKVINFELNPSAIELGEQVEVTAGYFEKNPENPVSARSLNADEIASSPGSAEDIFRVARLLPGVTSSSINANLLVRGGGPDENLTLLDNIEIYSPIHFGRIDGSWGAFSILNPNSLQNVEFISGGFPAENNGKLSSVFKLNLKEGNESRFNHDVNLNIVGLSYYADGPLLGDGNIVASVRRGVFDLVADLTNQKALPSYWDAVGKVTYNLGKVNKLSFVSFYYKDNFERDELDTLSHNETARLYEYSKTDNYGSALGLNWNYLFSDKGFLLTTLAMTNNGWTEYKGTNADKDLNGEDLVEKEYNIKSEATYNILPSLRLNGGINYKIIDSDHYIWYDAKSSNTSVVLPADTINYKPPRGYKSGLFLQLLVNPVAPLYITGGIRYDYFSLTKESVVNPRISFSWHFNNNISLNASYGQYSQDPASYQLELADVNKKLTSAKSEQYVLGIESLLRDDIRVSVEGFYKNLSNMFVESDTSREITNNGSGYAKGIEVFVQKKMSNNLVGSFSYTYSISKRKENNGQEFFYKYDRPHNFNLAASYRFSDTWQIGFKYAYETGLPYTPVIGIKNENGSYVFAEGEKNSERFPDYHQLDIRIDKRFLFENWTLSVYLDLWNVYNRQNVADYIYSAAMDGSINRRAIYDFTLLPILGVSAKF